MTDNRLFSEQELAEMGARTLDLLMEAIDAGDKNKAKALAQRMKNEFNYLHDGYMFWVAGLQTYIYKNYGIEAVEEAERLAHTAEAKVVFKPPKRPIFGRRWSTRQAFCVAICSRSLSSRPMRRSASA